MHVPLKKTEPSSENAPRLARLHSALLHLHKTLVDFERGRYETVIGSIQSPNHFLQLLTSDSWFAWLHPLSQLIVAIDEALEEKEPLTVVLADALVSRAGDLLIAAENAKGFPGHYDNALQSDPDVVLAHAAAIKVIGRKLPPELET